MNALKLIVGFCYLNQIVERKRVAVLHYVLVDDETFVEIHHLLEHAKFLHQVQQKRNHSNRLLWRDMRHFLLRCLFEISHEIVPDMIRSTVV